MPAQQGTSVSGRERTAKATAAQLARFKTPEERQRYFTELARKSHLARLTLDASEVAALQAVCDVLGDLLARHGRLGDEGVTHER
jgi:hypothetical protein